ncbi:4-hydroxyphenylacetate 3-monooxygenase, oxygenase component [Kyrpidia spormannii]|uniref:4-hydroxyphenylacetate 3-monooxygenase oxygenase component n=2 Tax=Kyrpidia spormannii TaxID=2055160 RepID=A0A2K8N968_9BACL|nr:MULTISPECIES: 4-hydroxyphenylacetate 3-monooxygenase, oxygenase component [Kyrpidia]HHY66954.1 4-hydroxyphenylacetate 3-monooxygenase, oxygenase component [Alicyclobacillus sp.]ATY84972.1 4-hydroxyphenylacetate 3-monooxygenase, oxygenase component [Kyrpidia spormannii]MCL6574700.1 4-hydroxyphenylacetate 3-monooxygenase, oxygenase component [Kyrpidia sp.]CAB3392384.1 4-hydroxyphenylacetate 3-monooxygenase oxygenase component [Kyrpidia spormannii]CAB3393310.1 4-hydroxyphenylacetate 3-monooxyg
MGIRTGQQYLDDLDRNPREIWIDGEKITEGITKHPAFRNIARSVAHLYDMQNDPALIDEMTYISPKSGERVGMSFLQPKTVEDLIKRRTMMKHWADYSGGMMGRSPDYLNSDLMALAAASDFFAENDPRFGENIRAYYEYVRENDLCTTHTLIHPQVNRAAGAAGQPDPYVAARVVDKTKDGIIVRGARMLATLPLADELLVFPSTVVRSTEEDRPYAYAFAVPLSTPGLRFLCRETFDYGKPAFDHPLGARFEEMDAVVVFDDVLVPWDRVFLLDSPELANRMYMETNAVVHMTYQVMVKDIAKAEFILGVASLMTDMIGIGQFQHVQEKLAKIIMTVEAMKAFQRASEVDASVDRWGIMTPDFKPLNAARNLFPRIYPKLVEILQLLGAGGLMAIPTEADMNSPIRPDIDHYYQGRNANADERIRLFRLAWDIAVSTFGGRQVLYERFFFGDPVRMAGALYQWYDHEDIKKRVRQFLYRNDD